MRPGLHCIEFAYLVCVLFVSMHNSVANLAPDQRKAIFLQISDVLCTIP